MAHQSVQRITITTLEAGQPRPYADSRYRYRIEIEWQPTTTKDVPEIVRWTGESLLVHAVSIAWYHAGNMTAVRSTVSYRKGWTVDRTKPEWHESRITEVKEIEPGVAEVLIVQPYLD